MSVNCSICGAPASARTLKARGGTDLTLWYCVACDFEFQLHDPTSDLAADKLKTNAVATLPKFKIDRAKGDVGLLRWMR